MDDITFEENIIEEQEQDESTAIVISDLNILVTEEDKLGTDIAAMSNFFDSYIGQLSCEIRSDGALEVLESIPAADIGLINDVVHHADAVMTGKFSLLPDFDHLPKDIKEKLDKGIYTVGESKQVDGNLRAVILDEEGVRVKDITLKQVKNDPGTLATTRSITNQLQMRQLSEKLDNIQELQSYQIDRDRDRDIKTPFLNARDYILRAQTAQTLEERKQFLLKASDQLTAGLNATYTDMSTTSEHLAKLTGRPIFQNRKGINTYMGMLTGDLQVATKFVGVQMHVLDYLGDSEGAKQVGERYQYVLGDFFNKKIGKQQIPAALLLHNNFPYTDENRNSWYELKKEIAPELKESTLLTDEKPVYLVSVEDIKDDDEAEE